MDDNTARPAVEDRGEYALTLVGRDYVMRPSYEAIGAIEAAAGRGLIDLARDAIAGKLTLADTAHVACECIRAFGRSEQDRDSAGATAARIACLILDSPGGFHGALQVVSGLLSLAVTGGFDSQGNPKPATMTKTTTEAPVAG